MALFKINDTDVKKLTAKNLDLERNLQKIFEANLEEILNIICLAHEYSTSFGGRIDTLGIDKNGAPCIIEYKKNQNDNVINQGLSYLRWLLDHKADFEILCQNKKVDIEIDWDSPRVICIAESYNRFDLDTVDILPIKIELLIYTIYENNILQIESPNYQKVRVSMSGITKNVKRSKREILQKDYTVEEHFKKANQNIKSLFFKLREKIKSMDDKIKEEPKKLYIAYKLSTNFADVEIRKKDIKIYLNVKSGQLNDPLKIARDLTKPKPVGHWGNGDYWVKLESEKKLNSIFELIEQSYNLNK